MIDAYLYLCKVYTRLDQPLTAIEAFNEGLQKFPGETSLLTGIARIYEVRFFTFPHRNIFIFLDLLKFELFPFQGMNNMDKATKFYKDVLQQDNMNVEAIACIATHYFYTDQPEIALKFYRQVFSVVLTLLLKLFMSIFPNRKILT